MTLAILNRGQVTSHQGSQSKEANAIVFGLADLSTSLSLPLLSLLMVYLVCHMSCQQSIVSIFSDS